MAKIKIDKKTIPILKKDLNLDEETLNKLRELQEAHREKFKDRLETASKGALERYSAKIKALKKAKAEAVKEYDEEIKKYEELVKELRKSGGKTNPRQKSRGKSK